MCAGDFYPEDPDEPEPEWVQRERESFLKEHDVNHDGKLDAKEIKAWIIPDDYDHTLAESRHLLKEADGDQVQGTTITQCNVLKPSAIL